MKYLILGIMAVATLVAVGRGLAGCRRPGLAAVLCALSGAAALFGANALGAGIAVNTVSAACAAVLGIPGVLMLAIVGRFF